MEVIHLRTVSTCSEETDLSQKVDKCSWGWATATNYNFQKTQTMVVVTCFEVSFLHEKYSCLEKRSQSVKFILHFYNTVEISFRNSVLIVFQFLM